VQAQKFGAEIMIAKTATQLTCSRQRYAVRIDDGPSVSARTVIIATGADYRQPALANLAQFEGAGVYHGATFVESQLCSREEVIVVGVEMPPARPLSSSRGPRVGSICSSARRVWRQRCRVI